MNNLGLLKELLKENSPEINNGLGIALLIFIGLNLITTVINIYSQHSLKKHDKKNISFKIKEEKRIIIFEEIYKQLEKLSFFDRDESEFFLNSLQETERYISHNKLHIDKKEYAAMTKVTDYYKTVIGDFRKKDYSKEINLFQKLEDLYSKW